METEDYKLFKMKQKEEHVNTHVQTSIALGAISQQPIQLATVPKVRLGKGGGWGRDSGKNTRRTQSERFPIVWREWNKYAKNSNIVQQMNIRIPRNKTLHKQRQERIFVSGRRGGPFRNNWAKGQKEHKGKMGDNMSEGGGSHFKLLKTSHIVSTQDCITTDNAFQKGRQTNISHSNPGKAFWQQIFSIINVKGSPSDGSLHLLKRSGNGSYTANMWRFFWLKSH